MAESAAGRSVHREPPLLTSAEVAGLLRVHPKHVYRLLRAGLPGLRVGGEWRFDRAAVLAWAERRGRRSTDGDAAAGVPDLVAANDDEAVALLLGSLGEDGQPVGWVRADSATALHLVADGRAAVAGFHRREVPAAGGRPLARVRFVRREIGLVGAPGRAAPRLSWCAERRMASRPATSGSRSLLDASLEAAGLSSDRVAARATSLASHRDVVCAVLRGEADVGITSRDWAERAGLAYTPLGVESYDLLVRADRLGTPSVLRLVEAAGSGRVRRRVGALPGHSAEGAGTLRGDVGARASETKNASETGGRS
jgi:excisionase family DNA binding protein